MTDAKTLILVRTNVDDVTRISYRWAEAVKQRFRSSGWQVVDLAAGDAIYSRVVPVLQDAASCVFLFYGHGWEDAMLGQDSTPVIDVESLNLLQDQKVYVVACLTTRQLGRRASNAVHFYLGYEDKIDVLIDPPYIDRLEDCVNKGILTMLDQPDCSIEQARRVIIDEYSNWIDFFAIGDGAEGPKSFLLAASLRHNRDALAQVFGDPSATLL